MRLKILALFTIAFLWSCTQAIAAPGDEIGSAVRIINLVTAEYEADERRLATGDDVRQDELIEVSTEGTGELQLRDDTKLALGPGSQLLLDQFVYDPEISGGAIVLNLVKGAFRFITGIAAKPAYVINTPTASITVRGTIFDVYVQASGMSWLLLLEGAIEVCNVRDDCRLHDEPGKLIRITPNGVLGNIVDWTNLADKQGQLFDTAFPFVATPPLIDPDPIFTPGDIIGDEGSDGPDLDTEEETAVCPRGYVGTPPNCRKPRPKVCPKGYVGKPPGCRKLPESCPPGYVGRPPYCEALPDRCPPGFAGRPPFCEALPEVCPPGFIGQPPRCEILPGRCPEGYFGKPPFCIAKPRPCPPGYVGKRPYCKEIKPCRRGWTPTPIRGKCCPPGKPWDSKRKRCGRPIICPLGWTTTPRPGKCCPPGKRWDNTRKRCGSRPEKCPRGFVGKPPNCRQLGKPCPKGFVGRPPNCKKKSARKCPKGFVGRPPNCKKKSARKCPKGFAGRPPNCKKRR